MGGYGGGGYYKTARGWLPWADLPASTRTYRVGQSDCYTDAAADLDGTSQHFNHAGNVLLRGPTAGWWRDLL